MELKKIVCETCGGKLEVNDKRTAAKCIVCGNVYFINDSHGTNITALLIRAQLAVEKMDFAEAENICEKIEALNDELAELWVYFLLIEAKASSLEELYNAEKDYTESGNYTKALYQAYSSEKDVYIKDLLDLKNKRIEKLKSFICDNPDLANNAMAEGEALVFLEKALSSNKSENDIYIYSKTEYLHFQKSDFYNVAILKFEMNKTLGLFKGFELEGSKLKKCYRTDAVIDIPFGIKEIGSYAFSTNTANSITIPDSVKNIEKYAFVQCKNIVSVVIPNSVAVITNNCFASCEKLESVTIPAGVTSIEAYAFAGCRSLRSIKIPERCTSIGEYAFIGCCSIPSLIIPESVVFVGERAFGESSDRRGWGPHQTIFIDKEQSAKWNKEWHLKCNAKILYKAIPGKQDSENRAPEKFTVAVSAADDIKQRNMEFFNLCSGNKLAEAKALWEKGDIDLNFSYVGNTAMLRAAEKGFIDVTKWLVEIGAAVDFSDTHQKTALMKAAHAGHVDVMEALLNAGADKNLADRNNRTALLSVLAEGYTDRSRSEAVALLLLQNGADPNLADNSGNNALNYTIQYGYDLINALIEAGADINKSNKNTGRSVLIDAIVNNREAVAIAIIEKGADLCHADNSGQTALHHAASKGLTSVASLLLEKGAPSDCQECKWQN